MLFENKYGNRKKKKKTNKGGNFVAQVPKRYTSNM